MYSYLNILMLEELQVFYDNKVVELFTSLMALYSEAVVGISTCRRSRATTFRVVCHALSCRHPVESSVRMRSSQAILIFCRCISRDTGLHTVNVVLSQG